MAERQIRRLKTQVKEERTKRLKGRPKKWSPEDSESDEEDFEESNLSSSRQFSSTIKPNASFRSTVSNFSVSTNLHSSKLNNSLTKTSKKNPEEVLEESLVSGDLSISRNFTSKTTPSQEYLKGALWLGRNLVMQIESLVAKIEAFKSQYLREVTAAASDADVKRACHRLTLLAASRVGEIAAAGEEEKQKIRNIIQVLTSCLSNLIALLTYFSIY
jgi:hypothetical protein